MEKETIFASVEAIQLSNYTGLTVTGHQPTAFPGESKNSFPRMRRHRISVEKASWVARLNSPRRANKAEPGADVRTKEVP